MGFMTRRPINHGTRAGFRAGCRCAACVEGARAWDRAYRLRHTLPPSTARAKSIGQTKRHRPARWRCECGMLVLASSVCPRGHAAPWKAMEDEGLFTPTQGARP